MTLEQLLVKVDQLKALSQLTKLQHPDMSHITWVIENIPLDVILATGFEWSRGGPGISILWNGPGYFIHAYSVPCETRLVASMVK